jgi:transcriptional regulator with XRE-family HTH domain
MDVGTLVREARAERGIGQAELARRAGTTQTYVSRVERGVVSPALTTLDRLFHAMGCRLSLRVEPLPHGNVSARDLRAELRDRTAEERIAEAMELSEFLSGVAAAATER